LKTEVVAITATSSKPVSKPTEYNQSSVKRDLENLLADAKRTSLFPTLRKCCGRKTCTRCLSMYRSLPVSSCSRHAGKPCVESGWFPHLSVSLWNKLAKVHNDSNRKWDWNPPEAREWQHENPLEVDNLSSRASQISLSESGSTSAEHPTTVEFRPVSPDYPPDPTWAAEVEASEVANPKPSPNPKRRASSRNRPGKQRKV
jgi:hypothetical protein